MVDGAAMQMSVFVGLSAMGFWSDDRGTNLLDGGAHFYGVVRDVRRRVRSRSRATSRSSTPSSSRLLGPLGIELDPATQMDQSAWPGLKEQMADALPHPHPRRVGRVLRRPRRVLRARSSR